MLQEAVVESRKFVIDFAEVQLMKNVASGDQRAIEFVLKAKGKGWNVNPETESGAKDLNYVINIFQKSLEEMKPEPKELQAPTIIDVSTNGKNGELNGA